MFSMHVPKYLWGDAILTASYLINRMPTRVLQYIIPLKGLRKIFRECFTCLADCDLNLILGLKNASLLAMPQIKKGINDIILGLKKFLLAWTCRL